MAPTVPTPGPAVTEDAQFLIRVVRDAERWNTHGLSEADMAVSFEMSPSATGATTEASVVSPTSASGQRSES